MSIKFGEWIRKNFFAERKISEVFIFAKRIKIYGTLGDYKPEDLIDKDKKV